MGAVVSRPRLRWIDRAGEHTMVIEGETIVGSSSNSHLRIDEPTVSRVHASFSLKQDGLWVRDLESRNGTFINGIRVSFARVPEGAMLRFGGNEAHMEEGSVPAESVGLWPASKFHHLVGRSIAMRTLFAQLNRLAQSDASIMIQGETGTGKEVVARSIHDASSRAQGPYIVVDCGALPENLLESELFGHTKGAFTGAVQAREGAFEAANGGTIFIDEIGELPLSMQPKLLRVLESRAIRRVGETQYRPVNVRVICATHRELATMVAAGTFREDLYFRLSVLPIRIPPVRERADDIPMLIEHFQKQAGGPAFSPALMTELRGRMWQGNVRSLRNFVERAAVLGPHEALSLMAADRQDPPTGITRMPTNLVEEEDTVSIQDGSLDAPAPPSSSLIMPLEGMLAPELPLDLLSRNYRDFREAWIEHGERLYMNRLLEKHKGNVTAASKEAGINRTYAYKLLKGRT